MFFGPIVLIFMVIMLIFGSVGTAFVNVSEGGVVFYDEEAFQDYADSQYAAEFADTAYEDNILLVVLTDESNSNYCYIAWVGDHIDTDINYMFGSDGTELGSAMNMCINNANYKYSLDSNLAQVVGRMQRHVTDLGLESAFTCDEIRQSASHLTNRSNVAMTEETVKLSRLFAEMVQLPLIP